MNVNDIPSELIGKLRNNFDALRDVRLLRTAQQDAQRTGDYEKALKIGKDIHLLWTIALDNYMKKAEGEAKVLSTEVSDIPVADKDAMFEKMMVLFMCCDIIESATIDMNDVLHRTNPCKDIVTFDDLRQTLSLAKEKLKYLQKTGDYMKDLVWADSCDNMYEMMCSKARSIMRKRKESKNWGENTKKFCEETKN